MRRTRLVTDQELDATVVGIVAVLKEYKLAWHINQVLQIELAMQEPLVYEFTDRGRLQVVNYLYETEKSTYRLLRNRTIGPAPGLLIRELPNIDYFLLLSGDTPAVDPGFLQRLGNREDILFMHVIDTGKLASKELFMF